MIAKQRWIAQRGVTVAAIGLASLGVLIASATSCTDSSCSETASCASQATSSDAASSSDASADAERVYPAVPPPAGCDPAADPKDAAAAACVDDTYALFVDATSGADTGAGTKAAPLRSLAAATNIDVLRGRPRIYACQGTLSGPIALPPNVSLIGGYGCQTWTYAGDKPTQLVSTTPSALRIAPATSSIVVSDFDIAAGDAVFDGESSVAVHVAGGTVTFFRDVLTAGNGRDGGGSQETPSNIAAPLMTAASGNGTTGGAGGAATCKYGKSNGGKGGDANAAGAKGIADPAPTSTVGINDGAGGAGGAASCFAGFIGANVNVGAAGGAHFAAIGTLNADGFVAGAGARGSDGAPGGAGGGGGGKSGGAGGGGGAGGCGGAGGLGGKGGGGSIALTAFQSTINLVGSTLTSKIAGKGQDGGNGEEAQRGGAGGGPSAIGGCEGGAGGNGSGGGGGAGGNGGAAVAFIQAGGSVKVDDTSKLVPGTNGLPGNGGKGGPGTSNVNGETNSADGKSGDRGIDLLFASPSAITL